MGHAAKVIADPLHPYTQMLVSAVPLPDPVLARSRQRIMAKGEPPSPVHLPTGCFLHPRCPSAIPNCSHVVPRWTAPKTGHHVACHLHDPTEPNA